MFVQQINRCPRGQGGKGMFNRLFLCSANCKPDRLISIGAYHHKKMLDLKRHDGISLCLHLGNTVNGLELFQELYLGTVSAVFEVTPLGSIEAGDDLEIQTTAADDALDALDAVDRFDGGKGVGKQLLSGSQRGLVSVGGPLYIYFCSESNGFRKKKSANGMG